MTSPLVPPEVDLRGLPFMPLYGHNLFGSEFDAKVSDTAWRVAVTLWWTAWNQVPAASLPNDDVALTKFADFGRDVEGFRQVKEQALHGFTLCDDGRLYHRKLSIWALEAWDRRVKDRERKAKWRASKDRGGDGQETGTERGRDADGDDSGTAVSALKRSEANGSEVQNRAVGVNQPYTPEPSVGVVPNGKIAVGKIARSTPKINGHNGQQWGNPAYVAATAQTLGMRPREGEDAGAFKDRVYTAVQAKRREARA